MSNKKKTRKDKQRAAQRREKYLKSIKGTNLDEDQKDNAKTTRGHVTAEPQASDKPIKNNGDLLNVIILVVIFIILISALIITENKYNYLSPLATSVMKFILSV